jgi:predicted RNase H-like nuclease (RuvC/YqgF family)
LLPRQLIGCPKLILEEVQRIASQSNVQTGSLPVSNVQPILTNSISASVVTKTSSSSQDILNSSAASYEKILSHIQEVTGVNSLDELVQRFKDVEEQNFSLFNYVNQVNNEVEKVSEELIRIQRQMESIAKENKESDLERKKVHFPGQSFTLWFNRILCRNIS